MSWSYSGDPSLDQLSACRFMVGDTDATHPILQDEEITYLISKYGHNDNMLYGELFSRVALVFARDIKKSLGPMSQDPTERLKFFREQARSYKKKASVSGIPSPNPNSKATFYKGMLSNPPRPHPGGGYID